MYEPGPGVLFQASIMLALILGTPKYMVDKYS